MKSYTNRMGQARYMQTTDTLLAAAAREDGTGFCLACGQEQEGVEPDAQRLECGCCFLPNVYGAEQLLLMGLHYTPGGSSETPPVPKNPDVTLRP